MEYTVCTVNADEANKIILKKLFVIFKYHINI